MTEMTMESCAKLYQLRLQRGGRETYREGTHKNCTFHCPKHIYGRTFMNI